METIALIFSLLFLGSAYASTVVPGLARAESSIADLKTIRCSGKDSEMGNDFLLVSTYSPSKKVPMNVSFTGSYGWKDDTPRIIESASGDLTIFADYGSYFEYHFELTAKKISDSSYQGVLNYGEDDSGWRLGPFRGEVLCTILSSLYHGGYSPQFN